MPTNPLSKLKKWWSKNRQKYDLNSLDGDRTELRRSTPQQSIETSEGSCQSVDEDVFYSDLNIPEKSRSEGALHKLKRHIQNKYKGRHSLSDLHVTVGKFKSEIPNKQNKNRRSRSVVKKLLCAIPEVRDLDDSDEYIKQPQRTCKNTRHSFSDSSSLQYLSYHLSQGCNFKSDSFDSKQHEEHESCVPTYQKTTEREASAEDSLPVSQLCRDDLFTAQPPSLSKCRNDWEAKGARPKEFCTKRNSATSSGISSMEDCLAQQSKNKSIGEYVKSTLPYTRYGHSASSPAEIHEMGQGAARLRRKWKSCIIKASTVQLNSFNGGTSESNVNQRPIQVINPTSPVDKMGSLKDMTNIVMKTFSTEEKVSRRSALEYGLQKIQSVGISRIAVIIGHRGDGKTVCGKHMLQQLQQKHKLLLNNYKDWQTVKMKHKVEPDTAIFIDNMFGTDRFRKSIYDKWQPYLDQIYAASTNGNVSTIIAIDKKVFEKYLSHNNCHKLFATEHIIDLTGEYSLKRDEMCNILKKHLRHFKNANNVRFCKEKVNDNTAEFVENGDLTIWEGTIEQISISKYPVGFPSVAATFASSIENIKQGVEYFYSPQNSIVVSINEIRRSQEDSQKKAAFAIGIIVQHGGKMTLSKFEAEESQINSRKRSSKDIKKVKERLSLKDALRGRILANEPITVYFREGLREIEGNFVDIDEGNISFRCVPIHYSAAISFGKEYAVDVIAAMPFDFISKFVGPPRAYNDRHSLYISLDPATYQVLFERFLGEIERKNVRLVMEHQYMGEKTFVSAFLKYISSEDKMKKFLQMKDSETTLNVLCHGMTRNYQKNLDYTNCTEHILKTEWKEHMKRSGQKEFFEKEAVKIAANQNNASTFEELIKRMKTFDAKCFDAVIQTGSKQLLDILFRYKDYRIDLLTAVKSTFRYHYKEDAKRATQFTKYILQKESSLLVKKAMREARKFASDSKDNDLLEFLASLEKE